MSSRGKCDKRHICFLTSIYREGTTQTVGSFALQILRKKLLRYIPRKTSHGRRLLPCTPCFRDGSKPEKLIASKSRPQLPNDRTKCCDAAVFSLGPRPDSCTAAVRTTRSLRQQWRYGLQKTLRPLLPSRSRFAAASSRAAAEGSATFRLTKKAPVVLATSGEEAR